MTSAPDPGNGSASADDIRADSSRQVLYNGGEEVTLDDDIPTGGGGSVDGIRTGDSWQIKGQARSASFCSMVLPNEAEPLRNVLHDVTLTHRGNTEMRYLVNAEVRLHLLCHPPFAFLN